MMTALQPADLDDLARALGEHQKTLWRCTCGQLVGGTNREERDRYHERHQAEALAPKLQALFTRWLEQRIEPVLREMETPHTATYGFYVEVACSKCSDFEGRSEMPYPCPTLQQAKRIRDALAESLNATPVEEGYK